MTLEFFIVMALLFAIPMIDGASNSDLEFDFTGYSNVAKLLVSSCDPDVHKQINLVLGGSYTTESIEIPTTNPDLPHVSCSSDPVMGDAVVNFTLYHTDNDSASSNPDKQRIEMKVYARSPTNLKATFNSSYIYSWWFKLNPTLKASNTFFHIFQLKAVGTNVDDNPVATFTITNKDGLHLRLRNDNHLTFTYKNMIPLTPVIGAWTQAFVQVNYKSGSTPGASDSGSIRVILKDQVANLLFDQVYYHNMYWPEADFVRPKWGLYRANSSSFQSADWELFQNVQIWKQ